VTPSPELQKALKAATFEVVLRKADTDPLSYEKPLPMDLVPYAMRSDKYWSVGTAFAIGPNLYVSAGHVLLSTLASQFGLPALRDGDGHVYSVSQVVKFSAQEDFIVFTLAGAPPATPLPTNTNPKLDDVVYAVGDALGEGIVIRDGLLTSETPEEQNGRWKWLRFSAAASPGNSGGPLLNASGEVIGVVRAKSTNENLNFALPIARVLEADSKAGHVDVRYTASLPNARVTQVAVIKDQVDLPKSFPDFSRAYQTLLLSATRRDLKELRSQNAATLFPNGNSAKLLATVYSGALPTFVQLGGDDAWDTLAADNVADQGLPGHGLVTTGTSLGVTVFRLKRPDPGIGDDFYQDPRAFMDLLLKGLKLPRVVGDQSIRITSLGNAQHETTIEDAFGRVWQVTRWPLGYADAYVVCYALPVPEGYVGLVTLVPSSLLDVNDERLKLLADNVYVTYTGTLTQWRAFLARSALRPRSMAPIKVDFDEQQGVRYQSPRLTLQVPKTVLAWTADSELELRMTYLQTEGKLSWDVGGLVLYQDRQHHTDVFLQRHVKPVDDSAKDLLETWNRMSVRGLGFSGVAGHDDNFNNFWIHDALSAPAAKATGIDPTAQVLYDVGFETQSDEAYPRDLEAVQKRLVQGTRILER
jgi:hypothetical protein